LNEWNLLEKREGSSNKMSFLGSNFHIELNGLKFCRFVFLSHNIWQCSWRLKSEYKVHCLTSWIFKIEYSHPRIHHSLTTEGKQKISHVSLLYWNLPIFLLKGGTKLWDSLSWENFFWWSPLSFEFREMTSKIQSDDEDGNFYLPKFQFPSFSIIPSTLK
jgi:hypothetical protein